MTATTVRLRRLAIFAICAAVVAAAPVAYAQRIWVGGGRFGGFNREPPKRRPVKSVRGASATA